MIHGGKTSVSKLGFGTFPVVVTELPFVKNGVKVIFLGLSHVLFLGKRKSKTSDAFKKTNPFREMA